MAALETKRHYFDWRVSWRNRDPGQIDDQICNDLEVNGFVAFLDFDQVVNRTARLDILVNERPKLEKRSEA